MGVFKQLGSKVMAAGIACGGAMLILNSLAMPAAAFDGVAPEIDPSAIAGAMTVLIGGALLLTSKSSSK